MTKTYLMNFLRGRLLNAAVLGTIIGIAILIVFDQKMMTNFVVGLLLGILNFVLLAIGCDLILSMKAITARVAHFVFWALRYLAIAVFIAYYYVHKEANLFAVTGGLLTMHLSIFITEMKKHLFFGKEG